MEMVVSVISLTLLLVMILVLFSRPNLEKSSVIPLSSQVRQLALDPSRRDEAVELCQQESGASKADARLAVELFVAGLLSEEVRQIASVPGRKIEAIKRLREETGVSLLPAKVAVENFMNGQGSTPPE